MVDDSQEPEMAAEGESQCVTLSLISHTNVGKTTLARTLLRRDVGVARDAAHVTDVSEAYEMIQALGWTLQLWDTPGFGDTARLLKRLKEADKPMGWFLGKVWDRVADRPLWCSQQAIKNVREDADVVLYLADASQAPEDLGYVGMEMEILSWLQKPVVVLLNQTGGGRRSSEDRQGDLEQWEEFLADTAIVQEVVPLDAFSRCWVQEDALLKRLGAYVPKAKREGYQQLTQQWMRKNQAVFGDSIQILADQLSVSAQAGREIDRGSWLQKLGIAQDEVRKQATIARKELTRELAEGYAEMTTKLVALHGLSGEASEPILELASENFGMPEKVSEPIWSAVGGVAVGATGGLAADIAAGGMTAFGGTILGAAGGGVGAFLLAKGFNLASGEGNRIRWSAGHYREQVRRALLGYLAVAHFGRGRGEWREGEPPAHWLEATEDVIISQSGKIDSAWKAAGKKSPDLEALKNELVETLADSAYELMARLYSDVEIPTPKV